ncbi:hydrolase [Alishewanella jeotgali KCTC 22429]|uniref:Hydrolase n=2 Tax=Alishewanella jeotgali TaxID=545533 RepID=H3ZBA0_9ALTE|nr:hydrolase [Alishewanella jeotgali KCTC 22429]
MRLDTSGMGDSGGKAKPFFQQSADIELAIEHFFMTCPQLKQLVLWGLCDAASAILIKLNRPDSRISGVVLLNPWVRQTQSHAQTMLKHYYLKRLISKEFWQKLLKGGLKLTDSLASLTQTLKASRAKPQTNNLPRPTTLHVTEQTYVSAMLSGWQSFGGKVLVITSGNDLTAQEFLELCAADQNWQQCLKHSAREHLPDANHTFASAIWRQRVEQCTIGFVKNTSDVIIDN